MYLLSKTGLQHLKKLDPGRTLFAFDFDGTLSKIVADPEKAQIGVSTEGLLMTLSQNASLAFISGRALEDLKAKLDPIPGHKMGNHGVEGTAIPSKKQAEFRQICKAWHKSLNLHFSQDHRHLKGVEIEDKTYSLTIHYRKAKHKHLSKKAIWECIEELTPSPRVILGKSVFNLIPMGAPHKGMALLELMKKTRCERAFYIGDDDTDEDVFSIADPRLFTVRVGKKKSSLAQFYIHRQSDVDQVLKSILSEVK